MEDIFPTKLTAQEILKKPGLVTFDHCVELLAELGTIENFQILL